MGSQDDSIAILGMGCHLPGNVKSPSQLWDLLIQQRSAQSDVPASRYNALGFLSLDLENAAHSVKHGGYFMQDDIEAFDNSFFDINNLEARSMAPQQRKLLEVAYSSVESAGTTLHKLRGSRTGVFVGNFTNDYYFSQLSDPDYLTRHSATGSANTILANRISHTFDLRGPSLALDTACSSSVYAIHYACISLDAHDCDAAIVASANLIQSPEQHMMVASAGVLSPDSTCHTFDARANGYGRAEAAASFYLKRLPDAIENGDPIRAIIRATAVNGDGKTHGIIQPRAEGQEAVILSAYHRANLQPNMTDYVEAHGTGTAVGDPLETESISRIIQHRSGRPTLIGGLKPSLGHSEAASGLCSLLKVVLAMEHGIIPATYGIEKINPKIKLEDWNIDIVRQNIPWPESTTPRASINSFGFGGANGHVIVEATPLPLAYKASQTPVKRSPDSGQNETGLARLDGSPHLILLSARSEASLKAIQKDLSIFATRQNSRIEIQDLAYTTNCHRSFFEFRAFLVASQKNLALKLEDGALARAVRRPGKPLPVAYIFTGQGAQWSGMGLQLMRRYSKFLHAIRYLDECLQSLSSEIRPSWSLENTLLAEASDINRASFSQPLCTALQIALVCLLDDWGVLPRWVVGHSSGEIAAAFTAGKISARQAIIIAHLRGFLIAKASSSGAMMAVGCGYDEGLGLIQELSGPGQVSIACVNSPENITMSGDSDAMAEMFSMSQSRGLFVRLLRTDAKAYHSSHMSRIGSDYEQMLSNNWSASHERLEDPAQIRLSQTFPVMISTVTGQSLASTETTGPSYWRMNLESTVQFERAIKPVLEEGSHLLELGPHSALSLPIKQSANALNLAPDAYFYDSALERGVPAVESVMNLVGSLFARGHENINYRRMLETETSDWRSLHILTDLPPYPWDYTNSVPCDEPPTIKRLRARKFPKHELLGSQLVSSNRTCLRWKNTLNLQKLAWIQDHKLGPSIVLPAAAYIAMAMEAVYQASEPAVNTFHGADIANFNFMKPFNFDDGPSPAIELFSELSRTRASNVSFSDHWWDFTVCSISNKDSGVVMHASCSIRTTCAKTSINLSSCAPRLEIDPQEMEEYSPQIWYTKYAEEGLVWGPQFAALKSLSCDRRHQKYNVSATTNLLHCDPMGFDGHRQYFVHPINIDGMIQAGIIATTAGLVRNSRALVPVSVERIELYAPNVAELSNVETWRCSASSELVGVGVFKADAELFSARDKIALRMNGTRLLPYQGRANATSQFERHPMVRVSWKPSLKRFRPSYNVSLTDYISHFFNAQSISGKDHRTFDHPVLQVAALTNLAAFENPRANILLIDVDDQCKAVLMNLLDAGTSLKRFESLSISKFAESGKLLLQTDDAPGQAKERSRKDLQHEFDLIIAPKIGEQQIDVAKDIATDDAIIIAPGSALSRLQAQDIVAIPPGRKSIGVGHLRLNMDSEFQEITDLYVICSEAGPFELDEAIAGKLVSKPTLNTNVLPLSRVLLTDFAPHCTVIVTVETVRPIVSSMSEAEMSAIKHITNSASLIIWVTCANNLAGSYPDHSPISGLSRSIMLEQPSVRFGVLDLDLSTANIERTVSNLVNITEHLRREPTSTNKKLPDLEYAERNGILHIPRFEPDIELNDAFRSKLNRLPTRAPVESLPRYRLAIANPGQLDTLHFARKDFEHDLKDDEVEVRVDSVGLNAKDLYVLSARVDTKDGTCSCECSGRVSRIGALITDLSVGDNVAAMAPSHFASKQRFPRWALLKLPYDEDIATASTIPIIFSTAIYALKHRAHLRAGESILIHSAAGGVGIAAIRLAQLIGAEIFCTVGNDFKRDFLHREFGIELNRIFNSRDESFLPAVRDATAGVGVDVVLNSLTGDLLKASVEACADFGRFIEIGKRDILDHANLDMFHFGRNITFTAFDLNNIFLSGRSGKRAHQTLWQSLLVESFQLLRDKLTPTNYPIKTFGAGEIVQAFRYFARGSRIGKVAVTFDYKPDATIEVVRELYQTHFSPEKAYVLVGCLGGLGRSISRWMLAQGARNFVFLGRSGLQKQAARNLVTDLEQSSAAVTVVTGDVINFHDVEEALDATSLPIGGVIQAAMGLSESLWNDMSNESWHISMRPKIQGTWNLHNALRQNERDKHLDFFMMTSSINGTIGTATESNYCAANTFLDAFARYRNSLGLPAIAIGLGMISEVGYLHENPQIESLLKRKGIHPIKEEEMLCIIDICLQNQRPDTWLPRYDHLAGSHVLTGVEFSGLKEQRDRGFEGDSHILADPRASLFAAAFERSTRATSTDSARPGDSADLPGTLAKALREGSSETLLDAILNMVSAKISNLVLVPRDQLRNDQTLGEFGMDSMLAAEFRTYIFRQVNVDVPFMTLLQNSVTVRGLAELIASQIEERGKETSGRNLSSRVGEGA